jgi:hopanoid-associated phosphorylase
MLGIVVSLSWELKSLTGQSIRVGSCRQISDDILVALSGIGAERARAAVERLLSEGATGLLGWGFAAALDDGLRPGSVILPESVISATGESYPITAEWHRRLYQVLSAKLPVATEALLESEMIVKRPDAKRILARQTRAAATDMESGAQARLALARGIPFAVVRVISDTASSPIPEIVMQTLDPSGAVDIRSCLTRAFLRPTDGIAMIKLAMQFTAARRSLKTASALVLEASRIYLTSLSTDAMPAARR